MELNQVLSQRTRLTQVPRPDQISVDHRSLAQLLGLASEYGQFFHFYNLDNSIDGDWEPMFSSDPAIAFSLQLSVDLKLVEARMFSMIDDLIITAPRALNLQVMTSLHGLVARMLTILSGRPCSAANAAQLYRSAAALAALTTAAMPLASFFELLPPEKIGRAHV